MYKRYQKWVSSGEFGLNLKDSKIVWSSWFKVSDNTPKEKWQLKGKLLNEYKDD